MAATPAGESESINANVRPDNAFAAADLPLITSELRANDARRALSVIYANIAFEATYGRDVYRYTTSYANFGNCFTMCNVLRADGFQVEISTSAKSPNVYIVVRGLQQQKQ